MPDLRISTEPRTAFGKGAARRVRRDNRVPGVIYGHGQAPVHITLPGHELMLALKNPNALLTLSLTTGDQLALPKAVQRHAIKGTIQHVDLLVVRRGEKVSVEVPITLVGEAAPDTIVNHELSTLTVETEATHIPEGVEVSVEGLTVGDTITAADVRLPTGTTLETEPHHTVVSVQAAPTAEQVEAELAEAQAEVGTEAPAPEAEAAEAPPEDGDRGGAPENAGGSGDQQGA